MNFILRILTFFSTYTKRIGICANVGLFAGATAGLGLSFLDWRLDGIVLDFNEGFYVSLVLAIFAWLAILFILCIFARLTIKSVVLPSLLNCLLTTFATVFLSRLLDAYPLAWLIGIILGLLIGSFMCRLNNLFQKLKK